MLDFMKVDELIYATLEEDTPFGDITTEYTVPDSSVSKARLVAKQDGVLAGMDIFKRVFEILNGEINVEIMFEDGAFVEKGTVIAHIEGPTKEMLIGERTGLNILQRLSGIATATSQYVKLTEGYKVKIADTRKTTPGLRYFEKYAVRMGGGSNHRFSLSDGVMIKDNHIVAAGGIKNAVEAVRKHIPHTVKVEVETENLDMVREAVEAGADIIMLDNMSDEMMAEAVKIIDGKALTEASGDMNEARIKSVAATGVDIISIGRLTHSVKSMDISLKFY